jgi:hypothetical protein
MVCAMNARSLKLHPSTSGAEMEIYQKVVGLRPGEVNEYFSVYLILLVTLGPVVYSASNRNEYQKQKSDISG